MDELDNIIANLDAGVKLKLTQNQEAIIDQEDYDRVNNLKWYARKRHNGKYEPVCTINKKKVTMARFILDVTNSKIEIDHINHNPLDNRKSNLRSSTRKQNSYNQPISKRNTSGYKGVSWDSGMNKWRSTIIKDRQPIILGYFEDKTLAAKAYNEKAKELFGEFAHLNNLGV